MHKIAYVFGAFIVLAVTFALGAQVGSQAQLRSNAALSGKPQAVEAAGTPYELMMKSGKTLPTEQWSDPF